MPQKTGTGHEAGKHGAAGRAHNRTSLRPLSPRFGNATVYRNSQLCTGCLIPCCRITNSRSCWTSMMWARSPGTYTTRGQPTASPPPAPTPSKHARDNAISTWPRRECAWWLLGAPADSPRASRPTAPAALSATSALSPLPLSPTSALSPLSPTSALSPLPVCSAARRS